MLFARRTPCTDGHVNGPHVHVRSGRSDPAHPDDVGAAAVAYDRAVGDEADAVYRESAAMDRIRQYRWNGEEIPEWDRSEAERQDLIFCVAAGALRDVALGRAQLRRMNLLESPGAILDDPTVVEAARHTQAVLAAKTSGRRGPSRAELLDALRPQPPRSSRAFRRLSQTLAGTARSGSQTDPRRGSDARRDH